jgi:hypothetical protein
MNGLETRTSCIFRLMTRFLRISINTFNLREVPINNLNAIILFYIIFGIYNI